MVFRSHVSPRGTNGFFLSLVRSEFTCPWSQAPASAGSPDNSERYGPLHLRFSRLRRDERTMTLANHANNIARTINDHSRYFMDHGVCSFSFFFRESITIYLHANSQIKGVRENISLSRRSKYPRQQVLQVALHAAARLHLDGLRQNELDRLRQDGVVHGHSKSASCLSKAESGCW